jgi:DNA-binding GntR family transcriptional regulator
MIRSAIVAGDLEGGSRHSVASLADSLGVSRTPVREALIQLAASGMVRFERNRGVRVVQTSLKDIEDIFELRLMLELPATAIAVERIDAQGITAVRERLAAMERAGEAGDLADMWRADRQFHNELLVRSGNQRLADYVDSLRDMVLRRGTTTAGRSRSVEEIIAEHRRILERLEARDASGAVEAMRDHIERTAKLLIAQEEGAMARPPDR